MYSLEQTLKDLSPVKCEMCLVQATDKGLDMCPLCQIRRFNFVEDSYFHHLVDLLHAFSGQAQAPLSSKRKYQDYNPDHQDPFLVEKCTKWMNEGQGLGTAKKLQPNTFYSNNNKLFKFYSKCSIFST